MANTTKQADKYEGMRIYTVVPGTVQTPIRVTYRPKRSHKEVYSFGRFENTRDIVQPAGRQAQQVGHVARMVEHYLFLEECRKLRRLKAPMTETEAVPYYPITGIVKACRDSFELLHVEGLLKARGVRVFEFEDTQEGLYEDVVTALATEPVSPFDVAGILDYLPLWTGK